MRRFLALSRSTHGVLDLAMPGFVVLLWSGTIPPWQVLALCLVTGLAGYTAVYALNDLAGAKDDKQKVIGAARRGYSVEPSAMRYPLARGLITKRGALTWIGFWFVLSLIGAWLLNPIIVAILLAAAVLEVAYVKLLRVTWWRTLVSGLVKSAGPIAAVYVAKPDPAWQHLLLLLFWLMLWEIGGQNIPADWNDIGEDRQLGARTIPLTLGARTASTLVVATLSATVITSLWLPVMSPLELGLPFQTSIAAIGGYLLLWPGVQLMRFREGRLAARLFDYASLYPLFLLAVVTVFVLT